MTRKLLASSPLFQGLDEEELDLLSGYFQQEHYATGDGIFAQGDRAKNLYVVLSGVVEIRYKPYDGEVLTVAVVREGGVFGWSAALGRREYTSCAVCTESCHVLSIEGSLLRKLCEEHPKTGVIILERLAEVIA